MIIQFSPKLIYLYENIASTTFGTTSDGERSSDKSRSKKMRRAASRGKYSVKPDLLKFSGMALSTISHPDKFYEKNIMNSCSTSRKTTANKSSARSSARG